MNDRPPPRPTFLLGQQLSQLVGVDDPRRRRTHVCGGVSSGDESPDSRQEVWQAAEREAVIHRAAGRLPDDRPHLRVALVCDAGLGKTTNMQWLASHLAPGAGSKQTPLLLRLDNRDDVDLLARHGRDSNAVFDRLVEVVLASVKEFRHRDEGKIRRSLALKQSRGLITLLIDGLDHGLSAPGVVGALARLLDSPQWKGCPVWVAGRPYAFDQAHQLFFADPAWQFLKVEPLAEPEVRLYLAREAGGDWYDDLERGRELLAVPRLLRLVSGILHDAVRAIPEGEEERRRAEVNRLDLRTAADVYHLAYFTPGEYHDPKFQVSDATGHCERRGLLASGLVGEAARMGLAEGEDPDETNYHERIARTAELLGAIAFEMFATNADSSRPEPNTLGVSSDDLKAFKQNVSARLVTAGRQPLGNDFARLTKMNNGTVDYLLFRELDQKGVVWHDRTVQAFFAAFWAMKHGSDRDTLRTWIVDAGGKGLAGYDDFWTFAAELPGPLVDEARWLQTFAPCYDPPQEVRGPHDRVQWHRRMLYHSFMRTGQRSPERILDWRGSFAALAGGSPDQRRIHGEILGGLVPIPPGDCPYGADPVEHEPGTSRRVDAFRMHRWQVTNEMYEAFDPSHRDRRWPGKHPLFEGRPEADRCPVVSVTWHDAWCFAVWCGCRLPTELEWEHACRAGSADRWCFGNDEAELKEYAWYDENSEEATHPVGRLRENGNGLFDVHGNVWEWCDSRSSPGAPVRVLRGGSWGGLGWFCRSALRGYWPLLRLQFIGFRLAAVPDSLEPGKAGGRAPPAVRVANSKIENPPYWTNNHFTHPPHDCP
jgi:formylglycine-generating enzyme required for sulfatase activity